MNLNILVQKQKEILLHTQKNIFRKQEGYFKITKDKNGKLILEYPWRLLKELKLIDREECSELIAENINKLKNPGITQQYNEKFNLSTEEILELANENINNIDNYVDEYKSDKLKYSDKEVDIERAKEILEL